MTLSFPVAPMRATLGTLPPEDDGWAYEVKWDGYRTLAFVDGERVRLQSSRLHDVTKRYPEMQALAGAVDAGCAVLDGELVVLDERGRPRFELIQRKEVDRLEAAFFVFDVLAVDDHDTIALPYEERRRVLRDLVGDGANWQVPAHRIGDGRALLDATEAQELEGVMAKRLGTSYRPGARSKDWRKVKHRRRADVVIGGFTTGTGNRSSTFGALLVGRWVDGALAFAGGVGTGFNQDRLEALTARLDDLRTTTCPFDPVPPTAYRRGAVWVEPVLGATVELTEFTNDGYVRQSSFIELIEPDPRGEAPRVPPTTTSDPRGEAPRVPPTKTSDPRGEAPRVPPTTTSDPRGEAPRVPPTKTSDPRGEAPRVPPTKTDPRR